LRDKVVILQMRVRVADAINFLALTRTELLIRIEAPDSFEQSMPLQDFVDTWDTAGVTIGGVENRGIGIGQLDSKA